MCSIIYTICQSSHINKCLINDERLLDLTALLQVCENDNKFNNNHTGNKLWVPVVCRKLSLIGVDSLFAWRGLFNLVAEKVCLVHSFVIGLLEVDVEPIQEGDDDQSSLFAHPVFLTGLNSDTFSLFCFDFLALFFCKNYILHCLWLVTGNLAFLYLLLGFLQVFFLFVFRWIVGTSALLIFCWIVLTHY